MVVLVEKRKKTFLSALAANPPLAGQPLHFTHAYYRLVLTRRIAETLIMALLIMGGQQFLIQHTFLSALWPITGVALAGVFLRGNFLLLGTFLGSLVGYLHFHLPLGASLALSFLFTIYIFLLRYLSLKWMGPITPIPTLKIWVKFCLLISLLSAVHISLLLKILTSLFPFKPTLFNWVIGWLGQVNGILCLTPLCLIFDPFAPARYFRLSQWSWWTCAGLIIGINLVYFLCSASYSLTFSIITGLVIMAYALRFGQIPTGITLLGLSVLQLSMFTLTPSSRILHENSSSILLSVLCFTLTAFGGLAVATAKEEKKFKQRRTTLS